MPIRRRLAQAADNFAEYVIAVSSHWRAIVSGAALGLFSFAYGWLTRQTVPNELYLSLLILGIIAAGFLAWQDQRKKTSTETAAPRIKLSTVWQTTSPTSRTYVTFFALENFSDSIAVEVGANIEIGGTGYAIQFSRSHVGPNAKHEFLPLLSKDGRRVFDTGEAFPLEAFMRDVRLAIAYAVLDQAAAREDTETAALRDSEAVYVGNALDTPLGSPTLIPFEVTYFNYDRTLKYRRSHLLTYNPRQRLRTYDNEPDIRIDLAASRDPEPEVIS